MEPETRRKALYLTTKQNFAFLPRLLVGDLRRLPIEGDPLRPLQEDDGPAWALGLMEFRVAACFWFWQRIKGLEIVLSWLVCLRQCFHTGLYMYMYVHVCLCMYV